MTQGMTPGEVAVLLIGFGLIVVFGLVVLVMSIRNKDR